MPCWYYEKKELRNTPSIQDGIDYETECRYRKEGARFIIDTGTKMDLGYNTMATGVVYFHRFYMFHSFKTFPRYVTACCCLLLAGKVEETPKKCKDIIRTAKILVSEQKFMTFGEDPKEEVLTLERILLQTIKFDLQVEHPYNYLLKYAKCLKGDKVKLQKMVQMAWTFVNDSLCTTLSLQWEPEIIAVALMYLAGKLSKFEVVDWVGRHQRHLRWWDMFVEDVTMDLLEDICHQVLDLYSQSNNSKPPDSPPMIPSSSETCRERPVPATTLDSASNTPNVTPGKSSKIEAPSTVPAPVSANGCTTVDATDSIKPIDVSTVHFPTYPANFPPSNNTTYPATFPPANVSVPPPPVNTMNHMVPPIHHIAPTPGIRPTAAPASAANQNTFQSYAYPPNTSYFPGNNPIPPAGPSRSYYPQQP
ncbi:cyclin-K [Pseudomyrmex gracilis]|uniref:cyclin-K n=1 Tax=Pseudomyrmex gracilis TaxID=219809 RepID=UPI000995A4F8|nr:cyclin-K [Pseudomyrmex gracilis]XP_020294432.1 cyclin-K [Pseudomyrmex gracilis]XP_020294433.1 cyclin-K [Pseudomyrmex gracilis]XP_020294434.1 cyclin-K [Pseudomyrmex gracilis]